MADLKEQGAGGNFFSIYGEISSEIYKVLNSYPANVENKVSS